MNIFKRLAWVCFLGMGMTYSTYAQAEGILSPEEQQAVVEHVTQFITELNLSEMDKPAFRYIMGDFFIGIVALAATDFSMNTNKKILKALIKGRNSRMKDLLSKEQYKVYKARIKERRENLIDFMKQQQKK